MSLYILVKFRCLRWWRPSGGGRARHRLRPEPVRATAGDRDEPSVRGRAWPRSPAGARYLRSRMRVSAALTTSSLRLSGAILARRSSFSSSCCVTSSEPICAMTCPVTACASCFLPHPASAIAPAKAKTKTVAATRQPPFEDPEKCSNAFLPSWSAGACPRGSGAGARYRAPRTFLLTKPIQHPASVRSPI